MAISVDEPRIISWDCWVRRGIMKVHRDSLDPSDPDHTYNYLKVNGVIPEEYGIVHPQEEMFKDKSRQDLMDEILNLRQHVEDLQRWSV